MPNNIKTKFVYFVKEKICRKFSLTNQRRLWNISSWWRCKSVSYLLKSNKQFHNCHKGQRCFILGNGPSLKSLDFALLRDEITFTVNQLPRNPNFAKLKTNYHFFSDPDFFTLKADSSDGKEILDVIKSVNTKDNSPVVFYKLEGYNFVKKYHLDEILNIHYYENYFMNPKTAFKHYIDFTKRVPQFFTVVHYAIAMAVYMGFKEIYLLGCDCSGFISTAQAKLQKAENALYSYDITENEKKRMESRVKNISMLKELRNYVEWFEHYEYLFKYCQKHGVKLYNATDGGLLEGIPRVSIKNIDI